MDQHELGKALGMILGPALIGLFIAGVLWAVRKWAPSWERVLFADVWGTIGRWLRRAIRRSA